MNDAIVIGSVPAMHYRPLVGRSPEKIDADTAELIREAVQELLNSKTDVIKAYTQAFDQAGVDTDEVRFVFWSWLALQTVAEPRKTKIGQNPFPAIFSFVERDVVEHIHPTSVFENAGHYVTSLDRKSFQRVRWESLPY